MRTCVSSSGRKLILVSQLQAANMKREVRQSSGNLHQLLVWPSPDHQKLGGGRVGSWSLCAAWQVCLSASVAMATVQAALVVALAAPRAKPQANLPRLKPEPD